MDIHEMRCFVAPEFGWNWMYLDRLPKKSIYTGHIFVVLKVARCIASDQNINAAMTLSLLQVGLSLGAHCTLSCSS